MSALIKPRIPCPVSECLVATCRDDPKRAPLRFDTVILNGAGTGAAAYLANGVGNDARAGVGVSYEGRSDGRVVLQLHNIRLRVLAGGTAVTDNDFSLPGRAVMLGSRTCWAATMHRHARI